MSLPKIVVDAVHIVVDAARADGLGELVVERRGRTVTLRAGDTSVELRVSSPDRAKQLEGEIKTYIETNKHEVDRG